MLVADHGQLASTATLGVDEAYKMEFSDDPALYFAMIANLYTNQKLAFVRETISNAWDAHIDAGIMNKPISITIDGDYVLTFRDYGKGIPMDSMRKTYNTLGGTTKRDDTKATGGFGLGCKSPLAYVDSFVVTTMNNGTKAIYNMVKSAVELEGRPGLIPITNMPTEESGLEVRIQLNKQDLAEINEYIRSVVYNGEIKAVYNNVFDASTSRELPTLGMSFEPGSYTTNDNWYRQYMGRHNVYIRYGTVIYPAIETPATEKAMGVIKQFMYIIGCPRILVQAAPDTMALAPSRESFSSQKMTEDGTTELVVSLVDALEKDILAKIPEAIETIKNKIRNYNYELSTRTTIDYFDKIEDHATRGYMKSSLFTKRRKHLVKEFINLEVNRQIELLNLPVKWNKYGKLKELLKKVKKHPTYDTIENLQRFSNKEFIHPIYQDIAEAGVSGKNLIFVCNKPGYLSSHLVLEKGRDLLRVNYNSSRYNDHMELAPFLHCKRVFITTRMNDLYDSVANYPDLPKESWLHNSIVVRCGMKKGDSEALGKKFLAIGYEVIDLTLNHDWDVVAKRRKYANAQKRKAKSTVTVSSSGVETIVGINTSQAPNRLISINCIWDEEEQRFAKGRSSFINAERYKHVDVDKPEYYVMEDELNSAYQHIGNCGFWELIPEEIRNVTVMCRNKIEYNKCIHRGAKHIDTFTFPQAYAHLTSKAMKKYVTKERIDIINRLGVDEDHLKLLKKLGIKFPVVDKLRKDVFLDNILELFNDNNLSRRMRGLKANNLLTDNQKDVIDEIAGNVDSLFEKRKEIGKLYSIFQYKSFGGELLIYTTPERLLLEIESYPEIIPAIRTLVKYYLNRKNSDE